MTGKYCKTNPGEIPYVNSIFQQPWWLDAVAPGQWREIAVTQGGETVARLPYVIKKKYGLNLLTMPMLTQILGPWLTRSEGKYAQRLSQEKDLITRLIEQLPAHDYFLQNFHYSISNWMPFYWRGFQQTTKYTYVIEDLTDLDHIWSQFRDNIRREIRKAQKKVKIHSADNIDGFLDINAMTFERQGRKPGYGRDFVRRLDAACVRHNARRIFFAEDAQRRIHAAVYIIWDANSAYYLMGGANPELRNSGATSLLIWESIKFASAVTKLFDFEGSMIEPVERFFRAFGAVQKPSFQISRMSKRMKILMAGRDLIKAALNKSEVGRIYVL